MDKLSKLVKILGYLDYAVSTAVLAYGLHTRSWLYCVAGLLGLVIAYLKPAERLKNVVLRKFIRKPTASVPKALASEHAAASAAPSSSYLPRRRYSMTSYFVGYAVDRSGPRLRVSNARDYGALLYRPHQRFQPGIKPTRVVRP